MLILYVQHLFYVVPKTIDNNKQTKEKIKYLLFIKSGKLFFQSV